MKRFNFRIIILFIAAVLAFNNRLYAAAQTISFTVNGVTFNMVVVEGGTFTMGATSEQGSDASDLEKPAHQVTLSTYLIGQTEVTQELWQAVRGSNPAQHTGNLQYPVERVSWQDCYFFINNLNQLLPGYIFDFPTEAQWEYAARGGKYSNGYKYSGSNTVGNVAWYSGNSGYNAGYNEPIFPVAKKAPNELGIYDMSGNVDEWVLDRYGPYSSSPQTNPSGPSATNDQPSYRVVRGGNVGTGAICCRVSYRNQTLTRQDEISSTRGFRLACKYQMATGVSLNNTSATLNTGQTLQLTATVTPSTAMNKNVTWKSSNTNVATVSSSGLVTAKAPGSATITVTTADGSNKSATCTITVIQLATGVSLNKTSATLNTGQTLQLTATVTPSNTSNKNVTWKSSNTTVATVSSSGLVTAKALGSATITVTTADGSNKSATCALTVNQLATGVSLNKTSATLNTGQTLQLTATVTPSNTSNKAVTWKSSNTSVATVSTSGLVTAKGPGSATITVTTADGSNKSATCALTVIQLATGVSLNKTSATLNTGQTLQLTATVTPSNTSNKNVTWKSSNTTVATVSSSGLVTAKAPGTATITVTTADGSNKSATCALTVNQLATGVSLNKTSATLNTGQTLQLTATVTPNNTTNKNVTWKSSNTTVATVSSSGLVTAKAPGTATITVTTADGSNKSATCALTVNQLATGVSLNKTSATLNTGQTLQLTATVTPSNTSNKNVTWTSSNTTVATVSSSGLVTAKAAGTATITVTTADGSNKSATCAITVKQLVTGITLNKSALYMVEDDEFTLVATVTPSNAANKAVTWSSTDPNIASVNNGVVTAYGVGECVIKATTVDGSNLSASCNVTVGDKTMSPRNNYLEADNLPDLLVGEPIVIPVRLVNAASITGLQADLLLPSGFTLDSRAVTLDASRNGGDHSVTTTTITNGIHITVASPTSKAFKGQGTLMYLRLKAAREIGKYNIDLNNITLTTPSAFVIEPADMRIQATVRNFRWGDVNGDGVADGNDLNMLINIVLGKISANDSVVKGDPNIDGEGNIDGSDINMLINILLGK